MSQRANILEELKILESSLGHQQLDEVYSVPAGYFETLPEMVLSRIRALNANTAAEETRMLSPVLSDMSREMPYMIPEGYFTALNENMLALVKDMDSKDEIASLSPLIAGIEKTMPYSVPEGFFQNLVATRKKPAKIVSMGSNRRWFRFAAAAVVTGIIMLAGFIYFNSRPDPMKEPYSWVKKNVKKVDKSEIEELVNLADQELSGTNAAVLPRPEEIKELMKDISDEELEKFLNETPDEQSVDEVMMN